MKSKSSSSDKNENNNNNWDILDEPVKHHVLSFFNKRDLAKTGEINREFYRLSRDSILQNQARTDYTHLITTNKISGLRGCFLSCYLKSVDKIIFFDCLNEIKILNYHTGEITPFFDSLRNSSVFPKIIKELSGNRVIIAFDDRTLRILDLTTQTCIKTCLYPEEHTRNAQKITCLNELSDGRIIYGDNSGKVYLWDLKVENPKTISNFSSFFPTCLEVLPDDKVLIGGAPGWGSTENSLNILDIRSSTREPFIGFSESISDIIKLNNNKIAIGAKDIHIINTNTGVCEKTFTTIGYVHSLTKLSQDIFMSTSFDSKIHCNTRPYKCSTRIWNANSGKCLKELEIDNSPEGFFGLPDGNILMGTVMFLFNPLQLENSNKLTL
ncbi:MAG: hypothetical protein A3F11_11700 [Gammaproteobacteria bacterium RIFCSPHIGHO2_12_FULL_37_14]|nr:MAG: hypothetical protein A3F11_11700 [Gammaproteobacteria bacterium RIFCSPHIGHO2_12_FULL_37_14]